MSITIDEFIQRIDSYGKQYAGDAEVSLKKSAGKMRKALKKASPVGNAAHPHKLNKSWKLAMKGYSYNSLRAEIRSTAPHFHLVNRGHRVVDRWGNTHGYDNRHVHFLENTVKDEWPAIKDEMAKDFYQKVRDNIV